LICAAVTLSAISDVEDALKEYFGDDREYQDASDYESAAGWLVFVAVMGIIIESLIMFLRILNFSIINEHLLIFGIVVSSYVSSCM